MAGVVYICCTSVGRYIIQSHLQNHPTIPIAGIVNLDRCASAGKANFDSLYDLARDHEIDILYCKNVNSPEVLSFIKQKQPLLAIQSGWSQKFGEELLSLPKYGCLGEHPSPIPVGRGAACVNWAIIEGQKEWGDSFFKMVEQYDAGPVYAQRNFLIEEHDDVRSVYEKVGFTSQRMIKDHLQHWYDGNFNPIALDETKATHYPRRRPKDGELDFSWDDDKIYNYVRALTKPYPGAYFLHQEKKIFVWEAAKRPDASTGQSGQFTIDADSQSLLVSTGNNKLIALRRLQAEGMPEIFGHEFFDNIQ